MSAPITLALTPDQQAVLMPLMHDDKHHVLCRVNWKPWQDLAPDEKPQLVLECGKILRTKCEKIRRIMEA